MENNKPYVEIGCNALLRQRDLIEVAIAKINE